MACHLSENLSTRPTSDPQFRGSNFPLDSIWAFNYLPLHWDAPTVSYSYPQLRIQLRAIALRVQDGRPDWDQMQTIKDLFELGLVYGHV